MKLFFKGYVYFNLSLYALLILFMLGQINAFNKKNNNNLIKTITVSNFNKIKQVKGKLSNTTLILNEDNINNLLIGKKYAYLSLEFLNNVKLLDKVLPEVDLSKQLLNLDSAIKDETFIIEFSVASQAVKDIDVILKENKDSIDEVIYKQIKNYNDKYSEQLKLGNATVEVERIGVDEDFYNIEDKVKKGYQKNIYSNLLIQDILKVKKVLLSCDNAYIHGELIINKGVQSSNLYSSSIGVEYDNAEVNGVYGKKSRDSFSNYGIIANINFLSNNDQDKNMCYTFKSGNLASITVDGTGGVISVNPSGVSIASFDSTGLTVNGKVEGENVQTNNNFYISNTNDSNTGIIYKGDLGGPFTPFIHNYGSSTNLFIGKNSGKLDSSNTGSSNIGIGAGTLSSNTTGQFNTANGSGALKANIEGSNNTASGRNALNKSTGGNNTAIGADAGYDLVNGGGNIYVGQGVQPATSTENQTIRIGNNNQSKCYIAGINNNDVNGSSSGYEMVVIDSNTGQLGIDSSIDSGIFYAKKGSEATPSYTFNGDNTTGIYSNATGEVDIASNGTKVASLDFTNGLNVIGKITAGGDIEGHNIKMNNNFYIPNTNNSNDTGIIYKKHTYGSGSNSTTSDEPFIHITGGFSLAKNNLFVGIASGKKITYGTGNTGIGYQALNKNNSGYSNTAIGSSAMFYNTQGNENIAIGLEALSSNTTGTYNVGVGNLTLRNNRIGSHNTAIGRGALQNTKQNGNNNNNIAIGYEAGLNLDTGNNNIYIGNKGKENDSNTIRVGSNQTECFIAGIHNNSGASGTQVVIDSNGKLGINSNPNPSSKRFKENINTMDIDSKSIQSLRPVDFRYKSDKNKDKQYGLIAEEVEKIFPELVVYNEDGQVQTVKYNLLPAILLHEIQKQYKDIKELKSQVKELKSKSK